MNDYARRRMMRNRSRDRAMYSDRRDYDYELDRRRRDYYDGRDYYDNRDRYDDRSMYDRYDRKEDYMYDGRDGHEKAKLDRHELMRWKKELKNADGTKGFKYDMSQIIPIAEKMGYRFEEYDENEFCMTVNMLYSDFCEAVRGLLTPDKELALFVRMAKAWLEDEDAPPGSEKLALYK